jgi:hypothetical protein
MILENQGLPASQKKESSVALSVAGEVFVNIARGGKMLALSCREPWATFLIKGYQEPGRAHRFKTAIIKSGSLARWQHHGPLLICASKQIDQNAAMKVTRDYDAFVKAYPVGVAIGIVDIVEVRPFTRDLVHAAMVHWRPKAVALMVGSRRQVVKFPVSGQLGYFQVPDEKIFDAESLLTDELPDAPPF